MCVNSALQVAGSIVESLQIVDNMIRGETLAQQNSSQQSSSLLEHLKNDRDVDATTVTTADEKGFDGFLFAIRL